MASNSSSNSKQLLSAWGLPQPILEAFHKKGLKQLYPWQAAALACAAAGNNLVYTAPTSGGKSLVADVLMLSRLHKTQHALLAKAGPHKSRKPQQQPVTRALIVLPYLSIVSEKSAHLRKLLEGAKWRVMGYKGDDSDGQPLVHPAERISICSIEKANGAINRMIQEGRLGELVSVTIDEAHMLADANRGAALEMLLSKLVASRGRSSVQIVAMSATMNGLDSLSAWLDAHLFLTNFRPVPLAEHAVFEGTVFAKADTRQLAGADLDTDTILQEQRSLEGAGKNDRESLLALVAEVVAESHSVLVFCAGRAASQSCAEMLAKELPKRLGQPAAAVAAARAELIEGLRIALSGSTDAAFEKLLAAGVAYHHAGLTNQERSIVEQGFSSGTLLVLTATSTLAAGVNLPARRVILRSLWQGVGDVSRAQYLQMVGRAGRAGHSAVGEAFLLARGSAHSSSGGGEWGKVCKLLAAPLPVLQSQLVKEAPAAAAHPKPPRSRAAAAAAAAASTQLLQQQPQEQENITSSLAALNPETQSGGPYCSTLPLTCGGSASGHVSALSGGGVRTAAASGSTAAAAAAAVSQQPVQPEVDAAAQSRLQHLLLDAFATELATTGESVQQLLQSTLAFFHFPWDVLASAAHAALSALRARRLTTLLPDTPEKPSHWKLTALGRAVVASALDPGTGLKLYSRLDRMRSCVVLGSHVQLLYVLQTSPALTIFDWNVWNRFMRQLSPQQRRVAEVEGIDTSYIDRRIGGQPGNPISDEQHGRFAAAVLLDWLVADVNSMQLLEAAWGKPNSLTKAGISRGSLQKLQAEVSKTAAMAALLAAEAEWWQLETLLAPLAAQVAAGVRPELLPLMKVPGMQPSHAAALHAAGLGHPDLLLCASEGEVAAALAAGLPANMRKRKKTKDKQGFNAGLTGNAGTNALVARAARSVLAAARQHAVLVAASVIPGEEGGEDGDQAATQQQQQQLLLLPIRTKVLTGQATVHQVWPKKSDPLLARLLDAWQLQSSFALALVMQDQHCAAAAEAAAAAGGSSGVAGSCSAVAGQQQLQDGVKSVGSCAGLHAPMPSALVLCWSDKEAVVLHLPLVTAHSSTAGSGANASGGRRRSSRTAAAAAAGCSNAAATTTATAAAAAATGGETAVGVWTVIRGIFGDPSRTVVCAGAVQVLAALAAVGVSVSAVVDDPCAAFLLWQPQGLDHAAAATAAAGAGGGGQQPAEQADTQPCAVAGQAAKAASAVVLGGAFKLQVPLLPGSTGAAATAAAKSALISRALMPPLRALLAKQQLSAAYESVEQPLLRAFAEVRAGGVCVSASSLRQQLLLCDWQAQVLQQRLAQLMGTQQQQQQVQQQETQPFGAQAVGSLSDSDIRVFLHEQRLLNISHERVQQLPLLQLLQLAGRGAVKRQYTAVLPLLRLLLTCCRVQQHQQQLQQLLRQYTVLPAALGQEQGGTNNSSSSTAGRVVLQPHPGLEPITGQIAAGWPAGFEGLLGFTPVPALPVLTSATNLAQQGFKSLQGSVTVAAAVQTGAPNQQQQQQDGEMYIIGKLCSITPLPAVLEQAHIDSQLLPWQVPDSTAAAAAAGDTAAGGSSTLVQLQQQDGSDTCAARVGSVRLWCGVTESMRELQLSTAALYSVLRPPPQQQQQWQQCGNGSSSGGCLAFLPGTCSISHLIAPSSSSSSFIGGQLQHLPLLVLAGLSQDHTLVAAATQNPDPLAAAAAAWLPASGLPQQLQRVLLQNVQSGVLDGVPVPAAAAPGVLFSVAAAALLLGLKPSAQREQLGAGGEWLKATDLAESLCQAFPGLLAWRERLLEDARTSRFLKTPLGRRLPFQLPPSGGPNQTAAAAKALKEGRRAAVSLVLLSAVGDVQRLVVGCMHRACAAWQASGSSSSCSVGGDGASGSGRGGGAQTGSRQQGAGCRGASGGGGGAGSSGSEWAPGRLLPGCQGAPSGFAVEGAAAGGSGVQSQAARFVVVSGSQVVLEVPAGWALPLLERCAQQVGEEVAQLLGFAGAGAGGEVARGADTAGPWVRLPCRWWWGGSLDVLQGNAFSA